MNRSLEAAYATVELLAATWPRCFSVRLADRRPLKVGISKDIAAAAEGAITPDELAAAMSLYCSHKAYLKKLTDGAQRVGLDGNVAGVVTAEQARHSEWKIERIEDRHSARTRARGLAVRDAAPKAKADAEAVKKAAEVLAGRRKPILRLHRPAASAAA